jgi:hypothetical protein
MWRILVTGLLLLCSATVAGADIRREVWSFTCYGDGRPFGVVWDGPSLNLHVVGKLVRDYSGFLVQHDGWFEVFAKRSDQSRLLHLIVMSSTEATLSVLHEGYADPDIPCE